MGAAACLHLRRARPPSRRHGFDVEPAPEAGVLPDAGVLPVAGVLPDGGMGTPGVVVGVSVAPSAVGRFAYDGGLPRLVTDFPAGRNATMITSPCQSL